MDFAESVSALADHAQKIRNGLATEEATKTALVMPFIQALGYNVFNPLEVVPEFVADIAGKKGEKVDYAIMQDGKPIMIIECKVCGANLNEIKRDQLHRYFLTLDSSIGILTDGIRYLFFSSASDGKNMDATPFMEFNLDDIDPTLLPELRKLCKGKFDLKTTLDTVDELKANRLIKERLAKNLETPQEGFISYFISEAQVKKATAKVREQYVGYVKRAFTEFIAEQVDSRLKIALTATPKKEDAPAEPVQGGQTVVLGNTQGDGITTTPLEVEGYHIVRAIVSNVVAPGDVIARDAVNYCAILFEDNNRKPVCRLHFNNANNLRLEIFDTEKKGCIHKLETVSDIYAHTDALRETVSRYVRGKESGTDKS